MLRLLELLVLPPLGPLLLVVVGLVGRWRWPRLGRLLSLAGLASLWLLATPWVGAALLRSLQRDPALDLDALPDADAIVVLSADFAREAPEFGGATVGALALQRLRWAAALHRRTAKPVLTSGGVVEHEPRPHAELMRDALERDFGVPVRWLETTSRDTFENARDSAAVLSRDGVRRVYLVTHAWHMPRAESSFRRFGLEVVPAPTAFCGWPNGVVEGLVPNWSALRNSALALHEWLGRAWYAVRE